MLRGTFFVVRCCELVVKICPGPILISNRTFSSSRVVWGGRSAVPPMTQDLHRGSGWGWAFHGAVASTHGAWPLPLTVERLLVG